MKKLLLITLSCVSLYISAQAADLSSKSDADVTIDLRKAVIAGDFDAAKAHREEYLRRDKSDADIVDALVEPAGCQCELASCKAC